MSEIEYIGTELELFAAARNWKRYLRDRISPHLGGDVLEVGAGIGATTRALSSGRETSWTCLEPDPSLSATLRQAVADLPVAPRVVTGTLNDLPAADRFDAILYIDVLEHIEDDAGEVRLAATRLKPGGRLIILCPAHQSLYSPFDKQIGHFRRYDARMMRALTPTILRLRTVRYLDSAGYLLSLGNRLLLRAAMPTQKQILAWDRLFVPVSRLTDVLMGGRIGKSVLAIWTSETQK